MQTAESIQKSVKTFAIPVLLTGAIGIAFAPIFVRLSELGPSATAFYRLLFALPVLWLWIQFDTQIGTRRKKTLPRKPRGIADFKWFFLPGLFFAADIAVWHWSIHFTTVANATLFANFAPIFVTIAAWLLFGERIKILFIIGLLAALSGAATLIGVSFGVGTQQVIGDGLGFLTAVFYAGYIISIKHLRTVYSTPILMYWSGIITCIALIFITLLSGESFIAFTMYGWIILIALALISHVGGQALIAYALAHLPASFASVALLLQPATAAILAWILFDEKLGWIQGVGAILVLMGIFLAWRASPLKK